MYKKKGKDRQVEEENCSVPSSSGGNEKDKCQLLNKQLAKFFFSFGIRPEIIVSPIFEDFVKSIVEYRPRTNQLESTFTDEQELMSDFIYPGIIISCCAAELIDDFLVGMKWDLRSTLGFVNLIFNTYYYYKPSSRGGLKIPRKADAFILLMLKSVLNMEDELQVVSFSSIIGSSEEVKLLEDEQEKASCFICAKFLDYIISQKEFWGRVKSIAQVWVILFQTRRLVNLEDSNIGYVYQMMEMLKDGIEKSREQDHFMYDCSWKKFSEMQKKIIHPIHAAAAFLDPAYMYMDNFEMNAEMKAGLDYMFENMIDSDEKEAFTMELQKYLMKLPELFTAQAITMLKTWHPRIWWDFCGKHTVPVLSKYAIRIVSQPCSNLFCRRYYDLLRGGHEWREDGRPDEHEMGEGWIKRVNTMIMNENSRSLKLEPIILDKLGEDLGAFIDSQYCTKSYISYVKWRGRPHGQTPPLLLHAL
ncbi:uncharacterized protein LOC122300245 [Carya illinoinensis]|uniref:uncharacterized protein LOC122300245 n=1 Tax=Carya illinoinensis TaxID=32201 RepID=UPI001C7288F1|nr:uncharacterized protein LOC122300245 [Carya illinoinensis]